MLKIYVDGSCRNNGSKEAIGGIGIIAYLEDICVYRCQQRLLGKDVTNNSAEYHAVYHALGAFKYAGKKLTIFSDSKLVINQINGIWKIKSVGLIPYLNQINKLKKDLNVTFKWLPREKNKEADKLAQSITEG